MRTAVVDAPINATTLIAEVSRNANGAALLFIGTVREVNDGRAVSGIEYQAYRPMAERELADIAAEAQQQFGAEDIVVEHRLGPLELGDTSVAIAVAHAHRGAAYAASRYVIEQIKHRVPIWKLEYYADGSREWVNTASAASAEAQ